MKLDLIFKRALPMLLVISCVAILPITAFAKETTTSMTGSVYDFDDKAKYEFSTTSTVVSSNKQNTMGDLSISGNMKDAGEKDGFKMYTVATGNLTLAYKFNSSILNTDKTTWHLIEDKNKKVDTFSLNKNILSGAIVVQSSKDGENWITDYQLCDAFKTADAIGDSIYTTKDVQLENGCFYRVIVVYELQRKIGEKKIAFVTADVTEEKKVAEVYSFYAVNEKNAGSSISAADEPRKEIASKPIKTEKDKGFAGEKTIDKDDPHFGWTLGTFVINGYTRETTYEGHTYYLKNVGDKVTLWFTLNQDINELNGNSNYSIAEDTKAYDQTFGVKETNFGHGTLIISFTDYQGKTHDPVIYTDFLAANATTGADTRVQLFEEGDYNVVLDYEIKNTPRKVGSVEVIPKYTDYKIAFSFSIRNGNCMVYPFDSKSGNELSDNAITATGFKLDMAKSRYLTIDVTRTALKVGSDGSLTEDVRFNRPAKDNETYEDEGVYTFKVTNLYTGSTTTKTLYVGSNKYYLALSKNNLTVETLNEKVASGYTIENSGLLTEPVIETEPEPESEAVTTVSTTEATTTVSATEATTTVSATEATTIVSTTEATTTVSAKETTTTVSATQATTTVSTTKKPEEVTASVSTENVISTESARVEENKEAETTETEVIEDANKNQKSGGSSLPFVILGLVAAGGGGTALAMKNKGKKGSAE